MIDDLNMYRAFLAVAKAGSVSAAARALFVSQPALSAQISRLEAALGVKLFFRSSRGVSLTYEGELCRSYVERAAAFLEAGEDELRDIAGLRSGRMRIGASDMTLRFYLLDRLERFRDLYPNVRLSVTNAPTPRTLDALRGGGLDFGVVTDSGSLSAENNDLELLPVREIRDVFVARTDVAAKYFGGSAEIDASALSRAPLIMLEGDTSTKSYVMRALSASAPGCEFSPAIELATSDLVLEFAKRGMGVASIVRDFADGAISCGDVVELDLRPRIPPRRMVVAYLKASPLPAAAKRFIELCAGDFSSTAR